MRRMHPMLIAERAYRHIFLLLIPAVRGLMPALILLDALLQWGTTRWRDTGDGIELRKGVFFRRVTRVSRRAVTAVTLRENFWLRPFHAVRVYVETDGGGRRHSDAVLLLSKRDAARCFPWEEGAGPVKRYRPLWYETMFFSVCVSGTFGAAAYTAAFLFRLARRFRPAADRIWQELLHTARYIRLVPLAVAAAGLAVLGVWLFAFVGNALYYTRFTAVRRGDRLYLTYGLFSRSRTVCRISAIRCVTLRSTLLSHFLGISMCTIQCTGYGKAQKKIAVLIPAAGRRAMRLYLKMLLPEYGAGPPSVRLRIPRRALLRYLLPPLAAAAVCLVPLPAFYGVRLPGPFLSLPFLWLAALRFCSWRRAGLEVCDRRITVRYDRGFSLYTALFFREQLGAVRAVRRGLIFYTCGETRLRHLLRGARWCETPDADKHERPPSGIY